MRLAHLHLSKPISYSYSLRLQDLVLEKHYSFNSTKFSAARSNDVASDALSSQTCPPPPPTLITFQSHPVYTVGRRHLKSNPLSRQQIEFLINGDSSFIKSGQQSNVELATFFPAPRGGLLTYHAPGQLTGYLIVNLRAHAITPRCFVRLLENAVIRTCARHGVPNTLTTGDPGVWIGDCKSEMQDAQDQSEHVCGTSTTLKPTSRKICAIGVHVTRGITSHGIGLNVLDAPIPPSSLSPLYTLPSQAHQGLHLAPGYLSWGFGRIIACGLEGKTVTWLTKEGAESDTNPDTVSSSLADEVSKSLTDNGRIPVTGVDRLCEQDFLGEVYGSPTSEVE